MGSNAKYLAWLDTETTGLDPKMDQIIEIAVVLTDFNLDEVDRFERLIMPHNFGEERLLDYLNDFPFIKKMHTENGIIPTLENSPSLFKAQRDVEVDLFRFLDKYLGPDEKVMMAGSGVASFDMVMMREHYPQLIQGRFDYRCLDIGQVRRFVELVMDQPEAVPTYKGTEHRAMDDVLNFIQQAYAFRYQLKIDPAMGAQ